MTYPARESTEPRLATVTISSPESDRVAYTTEDFDPLIWLRCEPFDVDVRMLQIYDNLDEFRKLWTEKPGVDENVILRDGSLVTFSTVSRSADETFRKSAFTFDLSRGGLPVDGLWTSSKPTSGTHLEIQPIHIGEAWVPERARYHYRTNPKSERIVTVNWNQNIVNAPIAASVFDPSNLELVIGDPIVDLRTGIEQRFGIAESSDSYELKPAPTSTGTLVVVAFTVLILTLFLLNLRRKRNA